MKTKIKKLSQELELPEDIITKVYLSFWKSIQKVIEDIPLKNDLSEEDFKQYRTSVNLPSIGKLNCSFEHYQKVKRKYQYNKKLKNENKKD